MPAAAAVLVEFCAESVAIVAVVLVEETEEMVEVTEEEEDDTDVSEVLPEFNSSTRNRDKEVRRGDQTRRDETRCTTKPRPCPSSSLTRRWELQMEATETHKCTYPGDSGTRNVGRDQMSKERGSFSKRLLL